MPTSNKSSGVISWKAPEYTEHHHSFSWYLLLISATAALAVLIYLITSDIFALIIIAILGFIVGISASHKPKTISYELSSGSLTIGDKTYPLVQFKSFSVADEGQLVSATLAPLKRFMLPVSVYMLQDEADDVLDALSGRLAHDERAPDIVDRLAHRLRF